MNFKIVRYTLGKLIEFEGFLMFLPIICGIIYREKAIFSLGIVAAISIIAGRLIMYKKPQKTNIRAKEGFVITVLAWFIMSLIGALPFVISGVTKSYTDAVFETASGFTTTGASILSDLESIPHCILFWRSFTHWIGGMGILVFMMIFLPSSADEMNIMRAESPGPSVEKMVPKVRETAKTLYAIYTVMTLVLIILLCITGMPIFDSICISFGTAGTGGFGVRSDSLASYNAVSQAIVTIGMIAFGVNFNMYFLLIKKKFSSVLKCEEVRTYLIIIVVAIALVAIGTVHGYASIPSAVHHAAFQVASIITTTGFATQDFGLWNTLPQAVLVMIMFIGACAGSTGGGLKVSRWVLYFKEIKREVQKNIHPSAVKSIRLDYKPVNEGVIKAANVFLMAYIFVFVASLLVISKDGFDLVTSFTSIAATMNNIGPGLGVVGPTGNFADYSDISKWVLIVDMIAGRLEILPVLICIAPSTWRRK